MPIPPDDSLLKAKAAYEYMVQYLRATRDTVAKPAKDWWPNNGSNGLDRDYVKRRAAYARAKAAAAKRIYKATMHEREKLEAKKQQKPQKAATRCLWWK